MKIIHSRNLDHPETCVWFAQPHAEEDAERVQFVYLHDARHVHAVGAVRLPHLLR